MDFNLVSNIGYCFTLVKESYPLEVIYYSHITSAAVSLIVGLFVFVNDRKGLANKVLFFLSVIFSLWVFFNLILWTSANSTYIMFSWSFSGILIGLMFILSLYLSYTFIAKSDAGLFKKIIPVLFLLPIIFLTHTRFNLVNFSIINDCEATEGQHFVDYYYLLGLFIFLWILILAILKYKKAEAGFKQQILLFTLGMEFFLFSFFVSGYISSLTAYYELEFWGILSMTFFIGVLAFMIVKFKAFNIKLLGTQALVVAQFVLIASMFAFVQTTTNIILVAVTLVLTTIAGWALVRSVKIGEERKEELQIMSDKLAQANDQLRKLDNAKTEFISIASHQLRTPLTAVKGFVSLLLEGSYGGLDPKQQDVLNKIYSSNNRLINLVEDLLNISRIESGRMEFKFDKWKLEGICQEVIDTFILKAKDRGLYLHYNPPKELLPEITIDGAKIHEVISNLVDNALKYTKKGGVTLRLEPANAGQKQAVRIIVSDTGIGIPAAELPYLFARFSRGKDISRLNAGGTGLGLYVGKSMVKANGGKIWAESSGEGRGSRFVIELPVRPD